VPGAGQGCGRAEPEINGGARVPLPAERPRPAAEPVADRARGERVGEIDDEADGEEDGAEDQDLSPGSAAHRIDELGQEGEEEERDLRVEHVDEHALPVRVPEPPTIARSDRGRVLVALEQGSDPEVHEVGGPEVADDVEGELR